MLHHSFPAVLCGDHCPKQHKYMCDKYTSFCFFCQIGQPHGKIPYFGILNDYDAKKQIILVKKYLMKELEIF